MGGSLKMIGNRIKKDFMEYRIAIILFLVYYFTIKAIFHAYCPMVLITGLPCPGCGMTRAIALFLIGEFTRSWNLQPQAILWIIFALWIVIRRYFMEKKVIGFQMIFAALLTLLIVAYSYRMMTAFPSYPPMTYRKDNLLSNILYFYEDFLHILWKI